MRGTARAANMRRPKTRTARCRAVQDKPPESLVTIAADRRFFDDPTFQLRSHDQFQATLASVRDRPA